MGSKVHIHSNPYAGMAAGSDKEFFQKYNPYGMTVSQQRHQYKDQIAEGMSLKDIMANAMKYSHVKPSTQWQYLINDTGEDIAGLRTYKSLGMEDRPLSDQFGGVHDLAAIKATLSSLFPDNPLYKADDTTSTDTTSTDTTSTDTTTGLTQADLDKWWAAIDKTGWGKSTNTTTTTNNNTKGMGDFMKFMMFMSMMQPQRTGGGSQYGYGGLNPGGVVSSYNPLSNISQLVSSFKTIPGIGGSTSGTSGSST